MLSVVYLKALVTLSFFPSNVKDKHNLSYYARNTFFIISLLGIGFGTRICMIYYIIFSVIIYCRSRRGLNRQFNNISVFPKLLRCDQISLICGGYLK